MLCLLIGVGTSWGAADYTLTPTAGSNNSYASNCDVTIDGITWNVTGNAQMTPWRIGGKSITNVDRTVYSKTAYASAVEKIDLTVGAASNITVNSLKLVYSTNSDFSNSFEITNEFAANSTISFEADFPANAYYKFVFNITVSGTSNKFLEFSKVEFYNKPSGGTTPTTYTVTFNAGTNGTCLTTSLTEASAGAGVTLPSVTANNGYNFKGWATSSTATTADAGTAGMTYKPSTDCTLYAVYKSTHSVSFFVNGKSEGQSLYLEEGAIIVFPSIANNINGKTFVGWISNEINGTTNIEPSLVQSATMPDHDIAYYAVFATVTEGGTTDYVLVEDELADWSGDYLIVYNNEFALDTRNANQNANTYGIYKNISQYYVSASKTIKSNSTTDGLIYHAAKTENGYSLYCISDESYLGITASTTDTGAKLRWNTTYKSPDCDWTLAVGSIGNIGSNTLFIRWNNNSGSYRFAAYTKSGQQPIQLFKKGKGYDASDFCTTIDNKTLSSISVKTAPTKITYTEGEKFDPAGLVITADYGTDGTEDVAYAGNEGKFTFNPVLTEALATTNTVVTITYGGKTTKQIITVNELPKYTVTFDAQAGSCDTESLTESVSGEGITLPSATCYDKEWTFAGWATAACNETTTAPTLYKAGATYKPTTDITLYAVYMTGVPEGETAFNRVTDISELTDGKKVVVVSNATNYALTLTAGDTNEYTNRSSFSMSDNGKIWTLTKQENEYVFKNNASTPKTMSTNGVPGTSTTNISSIGNQGASNGSYKYANWTITPSSIDGCFVITNTNITDNGTAALTVGTVNGRTQWGVLNVNDENGSRDASVFAMRIYAEGPSISATYNSNPIEYFNLTISSAGYATYYNAFAYKMPENVVGKIMVYEDGVVKSKLVYEAGDVVPVETPLLLKGNPATYTLVKTTEEATKSAEGNLLRGSHESKITTGGSEQAKYYKFSNGDNGYGWYYGSKDNTTGAPFMNGAHKAYLVVEPDQSMSTRFIAIDSEGVLTDIEGINVDDTNGNVYDLQGRRVQRAGNGMYIKNGKKVIF